MSVEVYLQLLEVPAHTRHIKNRRADKRLGEFGIWEGFQGEIVEVEIPTPSLSSAAPLFGYTIGRGCSLSLHLEEQGVSPGAQLP
eukprot:4033829-Amphidinium_carterae.1